MLNLVLVRRAPAVVRSCRIIRQPFISRVMSTKLDSENISKITEKEKEITGKDGPVKGGPTAQAQKHVGEELGSENISAITKGEQKVTGGETVAGGPTATMQSIVTTTGNGGSTSTPANGTANSTAQHSAILDSATVSKITDAEKKLTGQDDPVEGGPTAQAQSHAGQPITSEALHDITEGEKMITGGERVKGGPTSTAQGKLSKARNN